MKNTDKCNFFVETCSEIYKVFTSCSDKNTIY